MQIHMQVHMQTNYSRKNVCVVCTHGYICGLLIKERECVHACVCVCACSYKKDALCFLIKNT